MKALDVKVGQQVAFPGGVAEVVKIKVKGAHVVLYPATGAPLVTYGKALVTVAAAAA